MQVDHGLHFRWLHLRFLSGQQQMLFDNLRPRALGTPLRKASAI